MKLGEDELDLDESIAEIVAVIDDQSKMLGIYYIILYFLRILDYHNHSNNYYAASFSTIL